jgi:hypothetical protein
MGWTGKKATISGGGTVDTAARTAAAALKAKVDEMYKGAGDKIKPGSEVFVTLADGSIANYKNPTKKEVTVPANPTDASLKALGLTGIGGSVSNTEIISAIQTEKTSWAVDSILDFTVAEPANIAANYGKLYLNNKTGLGSVSTTLTFHDTEIYEMQADGNWEEFLPEPGWILTNKDKEYQFYDDKWNEKIGGAKAVNDYATAHGAAGTHVPTSKGKADMLIPITNGEKWATMPLPDWFNVSTVVDNANLKTGEYSKAEPAANVVFHFTPPAPAIDTWYGIINTGDGTMDVGGVQITGHGIGFWSSNVAGNAWTFIYGNQGAVPAHTHSSLTDGETTYIIRNGNLVKQRGA